MTKNCPVIFVALTLLSLAGCVDSYAAVQRKQQQFVQQQNDVQTAQWKEATRLRKEMFDKIFQGDKECAAKLASQKPYDYTAFGKCLSTQSMALLKAYNEPDLDVWDLAFKKQYVVFEKLQRHEFT